jgi:hypothetical protein
MNIVLDGDERRGANTPISWLYFTRLGNCNRGEPRGLCCYLKAMELASMLVNTP